MYGATRRSSGTAAPISGSRSRLDVPSHRPDDEHAVVPPDGGQPADPVDVHQVLGAGQPQRQHRHEALAPGQDLRLVAELGEHFHARIHRLRRVVVERGWFHEQTWSVSDHCSGIGMDVRAKDPPSQEGITTPDMYSE